MKEVIRVCCISAVEVRPERLEQIVQQGMKFHLATSRAVGPINRFAIQAGAILTEGGGLYLWTTGTQSRALGAASGPISWTEHLAIPLSREREILIGVRQQA